MQNDRSIEDKKIEINDQSFSFFKYPYYFTVKGNHEMIWYNCQNKNYIYAYTPSPMIEFQEVRDYYGESGQNYRILVDLGAYFTTMTLNYSRNYYNGDETLSLNFNKKYMDKEKLPRDVYLKYVSLCSMKKKDTKKKGKKDNEENEENKESTNFIEYYVHVLLFANYLVMYSVDYENTVVIKSRNYKTNEIFHFSNDYDVKGLILFKEDTKKISLHLEPLYFDDKSQIRNLYDSKDLIHNVIVDENQYPKVFYVADEAKYVKKCFFISKKEQDTYELDVTAEYYVSPYFIGNFDFKIFSDMLFAGDEGYQLQLRGKEIEGRDTSITTTYDYPLSEK